jgi:hypothetical protein
MEWYRVHVLKLTRLIERKIMKLGCISVHTFSTWNMAVNNLLCNMGSRCYFCFSLTTWDIRQNNISFVFIYLSLYYGSK